MALTLVLSVGLDPDLMAARSRVLQSAGYLVVSAYSIREAVDRFQGGDFDLVLLCQSFSQKDKDRLTSWIRASGARIPVVSISGQPGQEAASAGVTVGSHPGALLWGIREVLINAERSLAQTAMPLSKQQMTAAQEKKPPASSTGDERQIEIANRRLIHLAHAG